MEHVWKSQENVFVKMDIPAICKFGNKELKNASQFNLKFLIFFFQLRCETLIDACLSNPCKNLGSCFNMNTSYKCFCDKNFTGTNCESSLKFEPQCSEGLCMNNGTCIESPYLQGFLCECDNTYEGIFCEVKKEVKKIEPCPEDACEPNGECISDFDGGYYCKCADGSEGLDCKQSILDPCLLSDESNVDQKRSPCGDFGVCEVTNSSTLGFKCICLDSYTGMLCDSKIQVCLSDPCVNGECKETNTFDFECVCTPGYAGKKCDIRKLFFRV
jgi:hypothetical protein